MHKELTKFINTNNINVDKFYTKEFTFSDGSTTYYLHYFDDAGETLSHESFLYKDEDTREKDLNKIKEMFGQLK